MPPVVAFVVANWVAVLAVGSALAAGFAMIAAKKAGKGGESQFNQQQMVRSSNEPRRGVYGKAMVSGPLMFIGETGEDREWLYMLIAVAGHRTDGCELVKLDDEICWKNGQYQNGYKSHVSLKYYDGTQTRADSETVSKFSSWTNNHVGHGISYLRIAIKHDQDKFPSGIPNVKMLIRGKPVFDPRDSSQSINDESTWKYSTNWALCVLDYIKHASGVGALPQEINLDSFIAAAHLSDEPVEVKTGVFEKRYQLNGTFTFDQTPKEIVEGLLSAGAGQLVYTHGVYSLQGGAYYGPADLTLDDSSLRSDMQLNPLTDRSDICNAVRGTFIDPDNFWQSVDFPPVENEYYRNKDQGEYIDHDIDLENVTSIYQAQRLAKIHLERSRAGFTINFPAKLGIGFQCWPGRVVRLNFPRLGLNNKEFEVMSFNLKEKGVDLVLKETAPEIYDWALGEATSRDLTPNSDLPNPRNVPTVKNISFTSHDDHSSFLGELTWSAPANNSGYRYRIALFNGQGGLVYQDDSNFPKKLIPKIDSGFYTAKVWAINSFGYLSQTPAELTLNSNSPANVIGIDFDVGTLSLTIKPSVAGEIAQTTVFEVRGGLGDNFADSELLGSGKTVVWPDRHPNTQYYLWARTVNNQGQSNWFGPVTTRTSSDGSAIQSLVGEFTFDNYTWFAWADDDKGTGFTTNEAEKDGKAYFGISKGNEQEQPSGNWQEYEWTPKFTDVDIGDVFTEQEQQQLDDLMGGEVPGTGQQMLTYPQGENIATQKANASQQAAEQYALAQANLAEIKAKAHADGKVTAEEQRAIADAQAKADNAKSQAISEVQVKMGRWQHVYSVSKTNLKEIKYYDNTPLPKRYPSTSRVNSSFTITLITQNTGTKTKLVGTLSWDGSAWLWNVISTLGTKSNHPGVVIEDNIPKIKTWHSSNYNVHALIEYDTHLPSNELNQKFRSLAVNDIAAGNFTAQVGLILKLIANQALFNEVKARLAHFGGLTANEIKADTALINKLIANNALFDALVARIATFGGLTANTIAAGAIEGQHIKAGQKISSPVMEGGQVRLIGSAYMKVSASTPFGPDGLVEWYGPKLMSGSNPNWNALRKSNAITYLSANGDAYFGGSLSAGVLRTAVTNSVKTVYGVNSYPVLIGPFGTNRKSKNVIVSYTLAAASKVNTGGSHTQPYLSWQLQRKIGGGSWQTVTSGTFNGTTTSFYDSEDRKYHVTETCNGSSTYTDNSTSSSDFQYRVKVTGRARYHHDTNVSSQLLTLSSSEQ